MTTVPAIAELDMTLRRLVYGNQPIHDIASLVIELVENSIDAGATSIAIRVSSTGRQYVSVQDNGHGINPSGHDKLAFHYYSSHALDIHEALHPPTLGFQGVALADIRKLSKKLFIESHSRGNGYTLTFEEGNPSPHAQYTGKAAQGTRIVVTQPFFADQARADHLADQPAAEMRKLIEIMHLYAFNYEGIRWQFMQEGKQ